MFFFRIAFAEDVNAFGDQFELFDIFLLHDQSPVGDKGLKGFTID